MESQLDRSFLACVAALFGGLALPGALTEMGLGGGASEIVVLLAPRVLLLGAYVWFAVAVGRAERAVGENVKLFVFWVLAAPLVCITPIPFVPTILTASPLSLRFLLSRELRSRIHAQTFAR